MPTHKYRFLRLEHCRCSLDHHRGTWRHCRLDHTDLLNHCPGPELDQEMKLVFPHLNLQLPE